MNINEEMMRDEIREVMRGRKFTKIPISKFPR